MEDKELNKMLKEINREDLDNFLMSEFKLNKELEVEFKTAFANFYPKSIKKDYEKKIERIIYDNCDDKGYITYRNSYGYSDDMEKIVEESEKLRKRKNYSHSFDVIEAIFDSFQDTPIDDSNGSIGGIGEACVDVLEDLACGAILHDERTSDRILKYIFKEIEDENLYDYGIELYPLLIYYIDEKKNLGEIKMCINNYLASDTHDDYFGSKDDELKNLLKEIEKREEK